MYRRCVSLALLWVAACGSGTTDAAAAHPPLSDRRFSVKLGEVEVRGTFFPRDERTADADIVLDVRSASRKAEAQYKYRLHVLLPSQDPLELSVRNRHMYALVPSAGSSWMNILASEESLKNGLVVIRLDGAGEED